MFGTGLSAGRDFYEILSTVRAAVQNGIYCSDTAMGCKGEKLKKSDKLISAVAATVWLAATADFFGLYTFR